MIFKDKIIKTGRIPTYKVEEDIKSININENKPSSRIIQTKIGLKTIKLLLQIEKNNNHSWYTELKNRAKKDYNHVALFYRGNKITYKEMFETSDKLAKSLLKYGVKPGDEIPACLANTPELVYYMLAVNKIGAKLNLVGTNLDSEYLTSILKNSNSKLFVATDNNYHLIKNTVEKVNFKNKIIVSLADSLPKDLSLCDEYEPKLDKYYHYPNLVNQLKKEDKTIISFDEFINYGKDYNHKIVDNSNLDTEFTITYSSGSTRKGFPKAIIHNNRSYIIGGIYNDSNLTGSPDVPEIRGLSHIHSDSNTNLITCISDNLMKHGTVALEPEYDKTKFLDYVIINKPVHLDATTSFLIEMAKEYLVDKKYNTRDYKVKFPQMLVTMAVGEPTSRGEEKFINKFLRETKAGSGISLNGLKLPFAPMSIGGGDCEHGGIYYTLLKKLQSISKFYKIGKKDYGMVPVPFSVVTALKKLPNGTYEECDYNEKGIIVANSITSMSGYKNNVEKTLNKIIRDKYNRDWMSCDVYGYINSLGNVVVYGRIEDLITISNNYKVHCGEIDEVVSKDSKNILSSSTVKVETEDGIVPVINIEFSPFRKNSKKSIILSVKKRLEKQFPYVPKFYFRIINSKTSFKLTGSGKRDIWFLQNRGLKNTFTIVDDKVEKYEEKKNEKQLVLNNKKIRNK